jgi:vancomycin resistance protein VanJ
MKTLKSLLNALFNVVAFPYVVGSLLLLGLRFTVGESLSIIGLYNSLLPLLLIPALVLLPIALLLRRPLVAGLSLPMVVLFAVWYGPMFLPRATVSAAPVETNTLSVLTFNSLSGLHGADQVIEVVLTADADIVSIQELQPITADAVIAGLEDAYPYYSTISDQGLFSKYPLDTSQTQERWERAVWADALHAVAYVDGTPINVIVFHPPPPAVFHLFEQGFEDGSRSRGFDELFDLLETLDGPTIIAGDFNSTDLSDTYWRVRNAGFHDTYREVGFGLGLTFPQFRTLDTRLGFGGYPAWLPPFIRIDYVMHNGIALRSLDAEVLRAGDSDHYPVLVRLGVAN